MSAHIDTRDVPPLPTEPFTVIEPHWKDGEGPSQPKSVRFVMTLHEDGQWRGLGWWRDAATLQVQITGFEVLAVPMKATDERIEIAHARTAEVERMNRALLDRQDEIRREGAQAALKRVHDEALVLDIRGQKILAEVEREFEAKQPEPGLPLTREAYSRALARAYEDGKQAGITAEEREKLAYLVEHAAYSSTLDIFVIEWFEKHGSALAAKLEEKA